MHPHHLENNVFSWLLPQVVIFLLLGLYLAGVLKLFRSGRTWSKWRIASFLSGIGLLVIALSPWVMQMAHQDFRGHMVQHLLIGMLAPLGLVLGAPVMLALKALPHKKACYITAILGSSLFHALSHPITAFVLNIGGMFLLYFSPLYNATFSNPVLHHLIHLHFLLAGYLFTWAIAGPDPAPRRPGFQVRLIVLFFSIATHAYLSKLMYAYLYPLNAPHSPDQIRSGAKLMYYGGDFSELLLTIAFFFLWYKRKQHARYKEELSVLG